MPKLCLIYVSAWRHLVLLYLNLQSARIEAIIITDKVLVFIIAARFMVIIFLDLSLVQEKNDFYIRGYPNRWNLSANSQSLDPCLVNHCFLSVLSISTPLLLNSCISP